MADINRAIFNGGNENEEEYSEIGEWVIFDGELTKLEEAQKLALDPEALEPMAPEQIIRYIIRAATGENIEL